MRIRQKKATCARSTTPSMAWFMAAAAMLQFSAAAPESIWAKEPNTEDPFDPKSAGRPDRWGRDRDRDPNTPYRPDSRWHPSEHLGDRPPLNTKHWLIAQLTDKEKPIAFNIPPQPLSSALLLFSEQGAVQLAYTTEDIQGVNTTGVSGMHGVDEALSLLLTNTGIQYRVTGPNTITLEKRSATIAPAKDIGTGAAIAQDQLSGKPLKEESEPAKPLRVPEVIIKDIKDRIPVVDSPDGYKADVSSEAVLRFPARIQELPMSVSVVTQDSMRERRAVTQTEALEGAAGISKSAQFNSFSDSYAIRGFSMGTSSIGFTRDNGLVAFNNYIADPALYERIEVIKGAASFTGGFVSAGGFVNRLLKAPVDRNFVVAEAGGGSYGHYRTTLDANGVMPNLPLAGRFVFSQNEDPEFFRNTGNQRFSFLPSVRFSPREDFTVTITGNVQRVRGKGYYGTPTTIQGQIPAGIEDSFLGNNNQTRIDYRSIHAEVEKKFVQGLRLKAKGQYSKDESSYRYAYGIQYAGNGGIGPDGNFNISGFGLDTKKESFAGEINLTKDFSFFGNPSLISAGMDYSVLRRGEGFPGFPSLGTGNIANPEINIPFPPGFTDPAVGVGIDRRFNQTGAFIQGLLRPFAGTTLMVALRGNWIAQENLVDSRGLNVSRLTPQIGLSQRLIEGLNVYASYGESIEPNFNITRNGSILDPITGESVEVGTKWEPLAKRLRLTAALFRTELDNVSTPDPSNPFFAIGGQSQRNQGFEFEARGAPLPNLQVNLAYTFLDTEITKSTISNIVGVRAWNAPSHTVSAFGSYDFSDLLTKGLKLGAVVYYRSDVASLPGRNQTFEGYTRADLFALYAPLPWLSFQVNLNNLADARYVAGPYQYAGFNQFGAPRHVIAMVRMTF